MANLTKEEIEKIKEGLKWEFAYPKWWTPGGQHVARSPTMDVILKHDELGFEVRIGAFRSQHQNRQMCMTLFELFLSDLP